jgi:hypothetical protein
MNTSAILPATLAIPAACVLLALLPLAAGADPLVSIDFQDVQDGVAASAERNYALHLGDDVRVLSGGPTGRPFALFDGTPGSTARIDARQAATRAKGDETAASFWFRLDRSATCTIAFGFRIEDVALRPGSALFGQMPLRFNSDLKPTDFGSYVIRSHTEGNLATGVWHHAAFRYSMTNLHLTVWVDGVVQRDIRTDQDIPQPMKAFLTLPMAKAFPGALSDIRLWNAAAPDAEILAMDVTEAEAQATTADFEAAAAAVPHAPFAAWCRSRAALVRELASARKAHVRDWMRLQEGRRALPYLTARAQELAATPAAASLAALPGLPLAIYPYDMSKRLPFLLPHDGKGLGEVELSAAPGEYEAASFMLYPFASADAFHIVPTGLAGPGGAEIPAAAVDIRVVKCWFTSGSGWNSYFGGGRETATLSPELLVHDDALVKVVRDKRENHLRCSYPSGDRYIWISKYGTFESMEAFNYNLEPVRDAATFQPLPIGEGDLRQFWITVHVPADAAPGAYTGDLRFTIDGKPAGAVPLRLDVHDFPLPRAATRYNPDRPFYGTWMNHINLSTKIAGGHHIGAGNHYSNACRRLLAEYRNMAAHNMLHPWTAAYGDRSDPDFADRQLDLLKEAGLATRPIFGDASACDGFWAAGMQREREKYPDQDISVEANPELFQSRRIAFSNQLAAVIDRIEKKFGHRDLYCYGVDEAGPGTVRREMPFFMICKLLGGHPFISMSHAQWTAFATDGNDVPARIGRSHARAWHEGGAIVTTYAAPFSGPENPEPWRRKGIRLYQANFDGCNEYNWYEGWHVWNDFAFESRYKPFCIVYPTADGVIDTIAWEALRESFDDVRYLTLLRRLARVALRSGSRDLVRLGKSATAWAELIDPDGVDFDDLRAGAARWIRRLRAGLADASVAVPPSVYE